MVRLRIPGPGADSHVHMDQTLSDAISQQFRSRQLGPELRRDNHTCPLPVSPRVRAPTRVGRRMSDDF